MQFSDFCVCCLATLLLLDTQNWTPTIALNEVTGWRKENEKKWNEEINVSRDQGHKEKGWIVATQKERWTIKKVKGWM